MNCSGKAGFDTAYKKPFGDLLMVLAVPKAYPLDLLVLELARAKPKMHVNRITV